MYRDLGKGAPRRGRSHLGRLNRARRRAQSRHAIVESRFRQSSGLSGRAIEAL